jgi:hypothetical protein
VANHVFGTPQYAELQSLVEKTCISMQETGQVEARSGKQKSDKTDLLLLIQISFHDIDHARAPQASY